MMVIDEYKGLKYCGNDRDKYIAVLKDFYLSSDEKQREIYMYVRSGDMEGYMIETHSLKGISRNIGADALADLAYEHEMMSRQNNLEYVQTHVEELIDYWQTVLDEIKEYVGADKLKDDTEFEDNGIELTYDEVIDKAETAIFFLRAFESDEAEHTLRGLLCCRIDDELRQIILQAYHYTTDFEYQSAIEALTKL